ncbi:TolB family protein [Armatimonas rosea]|uniref:Tol biopolymer transport system component n=1 Tax=Armatimonas rosea TaxID=685828 RepID=A0A7W9SP21_ARMRO|nr:PD40 domain-containing protein [Armatimonas rosea]MBB6049885.1 Tol biopolymer transport system component [Armatimonas rosea]
MALLNRRHFLVGSASTLLGLGAGCGSGGSGSEPPSLAGYVLFNEPYGEGATASARIIAARPDGSDRKVVLDQHRLLSVSPDGALLEVQEATGTRNRLLFNTAGERQALLPALAESPTLNALPSAWSPDGQQLLYFSQILFPVPPPFQLTVLNRKGEVVRSVAKTNSWRYGWIGPTTVAWLDLTGTFRLDLNAGGTQLLSDNNAIQALSPDGNYLLAVEPAGASFQVVRQSVATNAKVPLLSGLNGATEARYSRDGRFILVTAVQSSGYVAVRIAASTLAVEATIALPTTGTLLAAPSVVWSPDFQSIAYHWTNVSDTPPSEHLELRGAVGTYSFARNNEPIAWL